MQVRELEREIGAELVERRPNEIALTDTGLQVTERAERILAATRDLVDFARHRDVLSGSLKLGIIPTLAPYVLPRVLPRLQAKYPRLRLELRETQTKMLLEELVRGELDCVMLALPAEDADVETLKLFDDPFLLAVPAADERAASRPHWHCGCRSAPADPAGGGTLPARSGPRVLCHRRGNTPAGLGATSLATVIQMVANGYGVTLVPEVAAETEVTTSA